MRISRCSAGTACGATSRRRRNLWQQQKSTSLRRHSGEALHQSRQYTRCVSRTQGIQAHAEPDELLRNEESRALTVSWMPHAVCQGARGSKDHLLGSGVGARRGKRNHSMELGTVRRLTRRIWTNAGTAGALGVDPRTGEERRTDDGTRSVQTLETSEEARRWNGGVDQPKRNDNAWRASIGNAS